MHQEAARIHVEFHMQTASLCLECTVGPCPSTWAVCVQQQLLLRQQMGPPPQPLLLHTHALLQNKDTI